MSDKDHRHILSQHTEGLTWANISGKLHPDISPTGVSNTNNNDGSKSNIATSNNNQMELVTSPTISRLKREDMKMFGANPLHEDLVVIQCVDCKKSLLPSSFAEHIKRCRSVGSKKMGGGSTKFRSSIQSLDTEMTDGRGSSEYLGETAKLFDDDEVDCGTYQDPLPGFPLKRKRAGAIDLDTQCGVMTPLGTPCTRPLTCHIHSMYAKYSVTGRSKDFEFLFKAYQIRLTEETLGLRDLNGNNNNPYVNTNNSGNSLQSKCRSQSKVNLLADSSSAVYDETFLDADKEVDALIELIQSRVPKPIENQTYVRVKSQTVGRRMRDLFLSVLSKTPIQSASTSLNGMGVTKATLSSATAPIPGIPSGSSSPPSTHSNTPNTLVIPSTAETGSLSDIQTSSKKPMNSPKKARSGGRTRKSNSLVSPQLSAKGEATGKQKRSQNVNTQISQQFLMAPPTSTATTISPQEIFQQPQQTQTLKSKTDPRNLKFI